MYGFANGGVLVESVTPGKGADKAGIQPDDVIVSVDGKPIKDGDALVADISERKVGSTVQLGYLRDGKQHTANVVIGDRSLLTDAGNPADENGGPAEADAGENKLGITVSAVPPATVSKLGLKGGVQVATVRPGSFADDINLPKGAIIVMINRRPIANEADYRSIVGSLKSGDDVVFELRESGPGAPSGNTHLGGTLP
jgi:serine protease Do